MWTFQWAFRGQNYWNLRRSQAGIKGIYMNEQNPKGIIRLGFGKRWDNKKLQLVIPSLLLDVCVFKTLTNLIN